jgi:RHS repeat-associated protein
VVAPVVADSGAVYTPGISERRGGGSRFYHGDIKNFVEQTDSSGQVVSSQQYDAFGNPVSATGSWSGPFAYGGRFGYQRDSDTSLSLLGHRYYDPSTGRFLTRDPIGDGRNWYVYCDGTPVSFADPEGLMKLIVRGNDDRVPYSGIGHWWTRPTWDPAKDIYMDEPSKAEFMAALVFTDEIFYFWGHGSPGGSLAVNKFEDFTMADLLSVIFLRWLLGIPKMKSVQLRSCWSCQTADNVNMWLLVSEQVLGFPGLTGDGWTLNTAWVFREPISFDPQPHPIGGGKRGTKAPDGKVK